MYIVAKVSEMTTIKNSMSTCQSAVTSLNENMNTAVMQVKDYWDSGSGDTLMADYAQVNKILTKMSATLSTACAALQTAIDMEIQNESANAALINNAVGEIGVPANM